MYNNPNMNRPMNMPYPMNPMNPINPINPINPMNPMGNNDLNNSFIYQPYLSINNYNMNLQHQPYNMNNPPPINSPFFNNIINLNHPPNNNNSKIKNESNNENTKTNDLILPKNDDNMAKMQLFKEFDEFQYKNRDKFEVTLIEEDCPICLINYKVASILKRLPCGHIYHKKCIRDWLVNKDECPICKYDLKKEINVRKEELIKNFKDEEHEDDKV